MQLRAEPVATDHNADFQHHRLIAPARGSFKSPSGRSGTWTGAYRLDGFSSEYGQLTATGVFTGHLADAGSVAMSSSSRHTCAVRGSVTSMSLDLLLGPLDVKLSGFLVHMEEVLLELHLKAFRQVGDLMAPGLLAALMEIEDVDPSITVWLSRIFASPATIDRPVIRTRAAGTASHGRPGP